MVAVSAAANSIMNLDTSLANIRRLIQHQKKTFEGNGRIAELMAACAIAQEPLWLLGDFGTAKTTMSVEFFQRIGLQSGGKGGYFEKTLHPYTEPSEIYGPLDFRSLTEKGEYKRLTEGFLPAACAAFLDEFANAPQELLFTTLSLLQHRVYHNGSTPEPSPLAIVIVASNEIPARHQLGPVSSRLPLRVVAESFSKSEERRRVLRKSLGLWDNWIERRIAAPDTAQAAPAPTPSAPLATFDDFQICLQEIRPANITDALIEDPIIIRYTDLLQGLGGHTDRIALTDSRTQTKVYLVMRALALLRRGKAEPHDEDLQLLEHIFEQPEDRDALRHELAAAGIPREWQEVPTP